MVKKIVRDPMFLQQKSELATEADKQVIQDLLDTLRANREHCVGMAANMIGVLSVGAGFLHYHLKNIITTITLKQCIILPNII